MMRGNSATEEALKRAAADEREAYYEPPQTQESPEMLTSTRFNSKYRKARRWWEQSPWERRR